MVLGLLLFIESAEAAKKGKGEVKLSQRSLDHFIAYIRGAVVNGERWNPMMFILSSDGLWSKYWYCPYAECRDAESNRTIVECQQATNVQCGVFAKRRTIYWDNGHNKKKPRINSKWSEAKIKEELTKAGFWGDENTSSTTTTSDETKYPKSLFPADSDKKEQWNEFKKYDESKEWPFSAWAEVRSKKDAYTYQWSARKTLKEAIKYTLDKCDERLKKRKKEFKKSEICIVLYLNGKETTDDEKIKYAEEYYGKELASKSFKKNSWILKNKSSLKKTDDDIVQKLKDLEELYKSGALTKEEFEKAKKKLLN